MNGKWEMMLRRNLAGNMNKVNIFKMKNKIIINVVTTLLFATFVVVGFISCSKVGESIAVDGQSDVYVRVVGVELQDETPVKLASAKGVHTSMSQVSEPILVPFDDNLVLEATLSKDNSMRALSGNDSQINPVQSATLTKATAVQQVLAVGTKYVLAVYDQAGNYVTQQSYNSGSEHTVSLKLDAGKLYTFVCLSYNSTTIAPPAVPTGVKLADAKWTNFDANQDLMYVKVTSTLVPGENNLNLILKHKFCQITTVIDVSTIGNVTSMSSVAIKPHYSTADLSFTSGAVTYKTLSNAGKVFTFPTLNQNIVTSTPTIVAASSTSATMTISSITIGGVTKTINIPGIAITAGTRYKLTLKAKDPAELTDGLIWAKGNLLYNNGNYTIATVGSTRGDYFPFMKLRPATSGISYAANPNGDPCSKVVDPSGYAWRTPTAAEYMNFIGWTYPHTTQNGVTGGLFNGAVFFPHYGYYRVLTGTYEATNTGYYFSSTGYNHFFFYGYVSVAAWTPQSYPNDYVNGAQIRCVRVK